ncbi:1,2-diacylglycerol 3-beta-glucosyltransferase [Thermostichus sp. MS-CIW-21]|uniref:glycosyltransferase n=1 Tax=unclassified Synechococcus TaxID=2626047 RepID=UPI001E58B754|nr:MULTISPECIES: glycosyltransferase family 2 protein [unclassified Synechococcus]
MRTGKVVTYEMLAMSEFVWSEPAPLEDLHLPDWLLTSAQRRRLKAFLVLATVWGLVSLMHQVAVARWFTVGLATFMVIHINRLFRLQPAALPPPLRLYPPGTMAWDPAAAETASLPLPEVGGAQPLALAGSPLPRVAVLIPAKNESAVLPRLLHSLTQLDYPSSHLELWAIDDASSDATPDILQEAQKRIPHLRVYRRPPGRGGGKSGALNEVLPLTRGEIILVCDADAIVPPDLLTRTLPLFGQTPRPGRRTIGAVQVRKALSNPNVNFWTLGQVAEMASDAYLQQQRVAIRGIGELRGNGQLVRRDVLEKCGGWNENSLTDDLDLTFKLHLAGVDIAFLTEPAIVEEGVTSWKSLWHQRCRWAEGGYQRYLDYWPGILSRRLGMAKTVDLWAFFISQYLLPMALVPDTLWVLLTGHSSVLLPLNALVMGSVTVAFYRGLRQVEGLRGRKLWWRTALGLVYMLHWLPVMIVTTARMCVQPKRLRWVKTVHHGL